MMSSVRRGSTQVASPPPAPALKQYPEAQEVSPAREEEGQGEPRGREVLDGGGEVEGLQVRGEPLHVCEGESRRDEVRGVQLGVGREERGVSQKGVGCGDVGRTAPIVAQFVSVTQRPPSVTLPSAGESWQVPSGQKDEVHSVSAVQASPLGTSPPPG